MVQNTYLGDAVEHDGEKKVCAIGLLSSLGLILKEGELALDAVPDGHLINVVEDDKGVESKDEPLHAVDGRQEYLLKVLSCFGCLSKHSVLSLVIE